MEIVNIFVSGTCNQKVNLQALRALGTIYCYNPKKNPGGYIQMKSGKAAIYKSGKYLITGIKSFQQLEQSWEELVTILFAYLDTELFESPIIHNIVARDDFGVELPLVKLQKILANEGSEYEPEIFPGLMWTTEYGSVNIFKNGKFMLLGCKTENELKKLDEYIQTRLDELLVDKN